MDLLAGWVSAVGCGSMFAGCDTTMACCFSYKLKLFADCYGAAACYCSYKVISLRPTPAVCPNSCTTVFAHMLVS